MCAPQEPEPEPEEEDAVGELPVLDSPRRAARRGKLIVQSVLGDAGSGPYSPTTVEKTEAELALIMEAFANKPIFSKLQPNQLADVAAIMQRRSFAAGDELTTEGSAGDTFFIIYEGRCVVQRGRESTHELPTGDSFGDIALIYNQPRTATITALTPVSTFTLDRTAYRNGVVAATKRQRAAREALLTTVPIIEKMSPLQRSKVADALEAVSYGPGARIITQGDVGDIFYIIERGEAIITEDQSDKRLVFEAGKFFGEIALIEDVPRTAHVHAGESGAECLTLGRAAVNRLFVRPSRPAPLFLCAAQRRQCPIKRHRQRC